MKCSKAMYFGAVGAVVAMVALSGCKKEEAPAAEAGDKTAEPPVTEGVRSVGTAPVSPGVESDVVAVPEARKDTDVVASVGEHQMTWKELNDKVNAFIEAANKSAQPIPEAQLPQAREYFRKTLTQQFITMTMLMDEAKRLNLTIPEELRKNRTEEIEKASGKKLAEVLAEYPLGAEAAQKEFDAQLMAEQLRQVEILDKVQISDDDVKQRIEDATVKADEAKKKFTDAQAALKEDKNFTEVVQEFSETKTPLKGLQKSQLTQLDPKLADTVFSMEPGQVSEPMELANGLLAIVKVEKVSKGDSEDEVAAKKAAAKAKLEEIRQQLVDGKAEFAKMAEEHSSCPSGKRDGGSLGEFGRGQMVKPFEDAAFSQAVGAIGPVIETDFGYHIVKVTGKDEAKGTVTASHILITPDISESDSADVELLLVSVPAVPTAEDVKQSLTETQSQTLMRAFFDKLKAAANITTIYPEVLQ